MDILRLIKLLNLSQSQNDFEALQAIRFANKMITDQNSSWGKNR